MKKFTAHYRIIYADTDAMGIVYHANYLKLFEIGRTEALREIGFPYKSFDDIDVMMPLAEEHIKYKSPAKYDDYLEIHTGIAELRHASVVISYEIYDQEGELKAVGSTKHAFTNKQLRPVALDRHSQQLYDALRKCLES